MFRDDHDQRPMSSQFAVRVAVLGTVALVAFAAIFFRLWYLEVLSSDAYVKEANANRVREIKIPAPRGLILDRYDNVLVDNRTSLALQVRPEKLFKDKEDRNQELRKLARVTEMHLPKVKREIREQTTALPASPATLDQNVNQDLVRYLRERQDEFPGITAQEVFVRGYPDGTLAAHLLGYVSEINEEQLKEPLYEHLESGDRIGRGGLEQQYDSWLRGRDGAIRTQVDNLGEPRGKPFSQIDPQPGQNLVLTLDEKVQQAGEDALAGYGLPGAFVAMDVHDGSILGMGSYPTYDPSIFTPPAKESDIAGIFSEDNNEPAFNRAIQGAYPTGSTFKLITALASLEEGLVTTSETIVDNGVFRAGDIDFQNAGGAVYGALQLRRALQVSSDVFFYTLGARSDNAGHEAIQDWAAKLGIGQTTGIDLTGEASGTLPTPEWRQQLFEDGLTDRPWSIGDSINLAVGQGDLQATPLQLATAYATLANGGDVVHPHLGDHIEDGLGQTIQEFDPEVRRHVDINPDYRQAILDGLHDAAMVPPGTSAAVFSNFPVDIAGKTGTAETSSGIDQSWYAAIAPYDHPKYVVVVTIEGGGFGAERAAPAARDILLPLLNLDEKDIEPVDTSIEVAPDQ
jgi:penicillin-binding protein 2